MDITDSILNCRRFLKRRNYSKYTLRNYMNTLKHYVLWVDVPVEQVTHKKLRVLPVSLSSLKFFHSFASHWIFSFDWVNQLQG
jgi:hypothetical protein